MEDRRYPGLIAMDDVCLHQAQEIGLTGIDRSVVTIASLDCLIISRYDRVLFEDGTVVRIHHEETLQALVRDAETQRRRRKCHQSGGPSLHEVAGVMDRHVRHALGQMARLIRIATFTTLIGNANARGKNLGFVCDKPGVLDLAPL